jgi:hypothetical protein
MLIHFSKDILHTFSCTHIQLWNKYFQFIRQVRMTESMKVENLNPLKPRGNYMYHLL